MVRAQTVAVAAAAAALLDGRRRCKTTGVATAGSSSSESEECRRWVTEKTQIRLWAARVADVTSDAAAVWVAHPVGGNLKSCCC